MCFLFGLRDGGWGWGVLEFVGGWVSKHHPPRGPQPTEYACDTAVLQEVPPWDVRQDRFFFVDQLLPLSFPPTSDRRPSAVGCSSSTVQLCPSTMSLLPGSPGFLRLQSKPVLMCGGGGGGQ